jgi:Flagellar motor protein
MLKDTLKRALAATPKGAGRQSLFSGNIRFIGFITICQPNKILRRKKSSTSKSGSGKSSAGKSSSGKPTYTEVETFLARNSLTNRVSLRQNETGIIFNIQAEVLFDEKSAKLRPESYSILNRISSYINTLDNDVIIAGHTDNQPINSDQYQSSWELSCDRAAKVLRYFTDTKSLNPERFQAVGYGSYRPIADNKTSSGRQRNRRVEIIIVKVS